MIRELVHCSVAQAAEIEQRLLGCLNAAPIFGCPAGALVLRKVEVLPDDSHQGPVRVRVTLWPGGALPASSDERYPEGDFSRLTPSVEILQVMDFGSFYLDDAGRPAPFMDCDGQKSRGLLDGHGRPLPPNQSAVYLEFTRADFLGGRAMTSAGERFASISIVGDN